MKIGRLEAFSDGVIAIIITIMVLELKVPEGSDFESLKPLLPKFISYILSFLYVAIYWNNHHHLCQAIEKVNGKILWANMGLLFAMSMVPLTTAWMGENHFDKNPTMLYGVNLLLCAIAFFILEYTAISHEGKTSKIGQALSNTTKENLSWILYVVGIVLTFYLPKISLVCYFVVAIIWLVPDKRIEKQLGQ
ncbi:MAG: DUF1211 domain-containing protein [Bacteroidetes bacterium]|nr:DUF1211 domain-containing protein [Bacteroidota bacterium]